MSCIASGVPTGVAPDDVEVDMYARGGNCCAGYLYPLAMAQNTEISADTNPDTGSAYVVTAQPGGGGSIWANVKGGAGIVSAFSEQYGGLFVVALEDVLDEKKGRFKLRGICRAFVTNPGNSNVAIGNPLVSVSSAVHGTSPAISMLSAQAQNVSTGHAYRYLGHALEVNSSTPSTPVRMLVHFDGYHGFGAANSYV